MIKDLAVFHDHPEVKFEVVKVEPPKVEPPKVEPPVAQ